MKPPRIYRRHPELIVRGMRQKLTPPYIHAMFQRFVDIHFPGQTKTPEPVLNEHALALLEDREYEGSIAIDQESGAPYSPYAVSAEPNHVDFRQ